MSKIREQIKQIENTLRVTSNKATIEILEKKIVELRKEL